MAAAVLRQLRASSGSPVRRSQSGLCPSLVAAFVTGVVPPVDGGYTAT